MRQKTEWQARASEDLRAGRIREGLDPTTAPGSFTAGLRSRRAFLSVRRRTVSHLSALQPNSSSSYTYRWYNEV
jgi:hypothetical protein